MIKFNSTSRSIEASSICQKSNEKETALFVFRSRCTVSDCVRNSQNLADYIVYGKDKFPDQFNRGARMKHSQRAIFTVLSISFCLFFLLNATFSSTLAQGNVPTIQGDVSCDDESNSIDSLFITQFNVGSRMETTNCPLSDTETELVTQVCDVNGDGLCNTIDALFILQCDVEIENVFCPAEPLINAPPNIEITSPVSGDIFGDVGNIMVEGTFQDDKGVVAVIINGESANINGNQFSVSVPVAAGDFVINAVAVDDEGELGVDSAIIRIDVEGPNINIQQPQNGAAVYSQTPSISVYTEDFISSVDQNTLNAVVEDEEGNLTDISSSLLFSVNEISGTISTQLQEDKSYTLTLSLADSFGNTSIASTVFYVPLDSTNLIPPLEDEDSGLIKGFVFDSQNCDDELSGCVPLPGAQVTLEVISRNDLEAVRELRDLEAEVIWMEDGSTLDILPESVKDEFASSIVGTVVSGPDGSFIFPTPETGLYWIRIEKDGFTHGQKEVEVVSGHTKLVSDIYLTPKDTATTMCDHTGCNHVNSDSSIIIDIPEGAIEEGVVLPTSATMLNQVEFLPNGELPPGTWETYAFELNGGTEDITFSKPVTIYITNTLDFDAGTQIPLGFWNEKTQAWEHAGTGTVDENGEWLVLQVTHFSTYDCNDPVVPADENGAQPAAEDLSDDDQPEPDGDCPPNPMTPCDEAPTCEDAKENLCILDLKTGKFTEKINLPNINTIGGPMSPDLIYGTGSVVPNEITDIQLSIGQGPNTQLGDYVRFRFFVEGTLTDRFTFELDLEGNDAGRYRYLWDGKDENGNPVPSGIYTYQVLLQIPYETEYCYALDGIFGNPPDCEFGRTGRFLTGIEDVWLEGTIEIDSQVDSAYGAGWRVDGVQELYENEEGQILIVDGDDKSEFYFAGKNLLFPFRRVTNDQPNLLISNQNLSKPSISIDRSSSQSQINSTSVCGEVITNTVWTVA
ncbi:MAG: FlgD immunoglobulin-like domain containing protein, partial [Chloroflexota bacterium]